jgi:hypothetical protein
MGRPFLLSGLRPRVNVGGFCDSSGCAGHAQSLSPVGRRAVADDEVALSTGNSDAIANLLTPLVGRVMVSNPSKTERQTSSSQLVRRGQDRGGCRGRPSSVGGAVASPRDNRDRRGDVKATFGRIFGACVDARKSPGNRRDSAWLW